MPLSSLTFLYFFFPLLAAFVWCLPKRATKGVLLAASILFFAWGAPRFVLVFLASCVIDFALARTRARAAYVCAIALNIALLVFFKYFWHSSFLVPLGVSFWTFRKISYLVDSRRAGAADFSASLPAQFCDYLSYVAFFPTLLSGPIGKWKDEASIARNFSGGFCRIAIGLAKKTLIANPLGVLVDEAFAIPGELGAAAAWIGILAYTMQIYFDFAGYTDMAIGVGKIVGVRVPENFDRPYLAESMRDFWRRWHITLGAFMREYLYIPLGGNRCSPRRCTINHWIVFLLSGIWHGADFCFLIWGAWHGLGILFVRGRAITFLWVLLGWIFFRAGCCAENTLAVAGNYFAALVRGGGASLESLGDSRIICALVVAVVLAFLPRKNLFTLPPTLRYALCIVLLALATIPLLMGDYSPFIYFRF